MVRLEMLEISCLLIFILRERRWLYLTLCWGVPRARVVAEGSLFLSGGTACSHGPNLSTRPAFSQGGRFRGDRVRCDTPPARLPALFAFAWGRSRLVPVSGVLRPWLPQCHRYRPRLYVTGSLSVPEEQSLRSPGCSLSENDPLLSTVPREAAGLCPFQDGF